MPGIKKSEKCRICDNFDDINDQSECLDCEDESNFTNDAFNPESTTWEDVTKDRQTSFTVCEVCGEPKNCVAIKEESFVIDVCKDCLQVV